MNRPVLIVIDMLNDVTLRYMKDKMAVVLTNQEIQSSLIPVK